MGPSSNRLQIDAIWGKTSTLPLGKKNRSAIADWPPQSCCHGGTAWSRLLCSLIDAFCNNSTPGSLGSHALARADISWWHIFIEHLNGISLVPLAAPANFLTLDVSGTWGCGALHYNQWLQLAWPPEWVDLPTAPKELVPIVLAVALWAPQ